MIDPSGDNGAMERSPDDEQADSATEESVEALAAMDPADAPDLAETLAEQLAQELETDDPHRDPATGSGP